MTQTEKDQKRADLLTKQQMLEDELRALDATPVTTYKVWEPALNEHYFFTLRNTSESHAGLASDWARIITGQAHPTKEAAERHHSFLVMLHDLHKFAVEHNEGWKPAHQDGSVVGEAICYNHDKKELCVKFHTYVQSTVLPYFKPNSGASEKAIDTFGERLKILFEYYNS